MKTVSETWNTTANGITYERAVELEGHEYPRIATAVFRFDELTAAERAATIAAKKAELSWAIAEKTRVVRDANAGYAKIRDEQVHGIRYGGQDSMIKPLLNMRKKEATKRVKRLTKHIADLETRANALDSI